MNEEIKEKLDLNPNNMNEIAKEAYYQLENYIFTLEKTQNNWNELKKCIEQDIRQCEELIEQCPKELRNTIIGTRSYEEIIGYNKYILSKIQKMEEKQC